MTLREVRPLQLEEITAAIPGVIYQFRVDTDGAWSFLYLSEGIRELYEIEPAAVYADHGVLTSCILDEDRASLRQSVADSLANLSPWFHEHRIRTSSGKVKWVRGQATPAALADGSVLWNGILTDITEQKGIAEELRNNCALLEQQNALLATYQQERKAEDHLAKEIVDRLLRAHSAEESCIRHWTRPVETFNGDIVAYVRSPKDLIYILFADATGHGLPAAICAIPILPLFLRLAKMSLPIEAIARNLNQAFKAALPHDRFVCANLASFSPSNGHVRLWNAGMPDVLHVNASGSVLRRYKSRNTPLGIAAFSLNTDSTAGFYLQNGERLIFVSDGVVESQDRAGIQFGFDRVEELLLSTPPDGFVAGLERSLNAFAGSNASRDDASVMELRYEH